MLRRKIGLEQLEFLESIILHHTYFIILKLKICYTDDKADIFNQKITVFWKIHMNHHCIMINRCDQREILDEITCVHEVLPRTFSVIIIIKKINGLPASLCPNCFSNFHHLVCISIPYWYLVLIGFSTDRDRFEPIQHDLNDIITQASKPFSLVEHF